MAQYMPTKIVRIMIVHVHTGVREHHHELQSQNNAHINHKVNYAQKH